MLLGICRRGEGGIQRRNGFREWRVLLICEERVRDVRGRGFIGGLGVLMVVEMESDDGERVNGEDGRVRGDGGFEGFRRRKVNRRRWRL